MLLLKYAGLSAQGYYGLATRIMDIIFIVPSTMSILLMREMSKAFNNNDLEQIRFLLNKYIFLNDHQ